MPFPLVLHGPSFDPSLPLISPEALAAAANAAFAATNGTSVLTGADPTGVADSTAAVLAAAATGLNVSLGKGRFLLRDQIPLSNGQELYGAGRGMTTLLIDDTFNPSATGAISLNGREQLSPSVRDLSIQFAQPSDQGSRANFKTLAAGGTSATGGTGVKYPPAIIATTANRFRLYRLRISRAWDGIANAAGNTIGGFFIRDIEMSAFNAGLAIDNCLDFGHVSGLHFWPFDMSGSSLLYTGVYSDGLTFAAKFGANATAEGIGFVDCKIANARMSVANSDSWVQFTNVGMDGDNATLEISGGQFIQLSEVYFTGSPMGANPNTAQLNVSGGLVIVSTNKMASVRPCANLTGGTLQIDGGEIVAIRPEYSAITQSGGELRISNVRFGANTGAGAWTVPLIASSGGSISFTNNRFISGSVGDVGGLVIGVDGTYQEVSGNFWNGWGWSPPGLLGSYGFNGGTSVSSIAVQKGGTFGSATGGGVNLALQSAAGAQRAIPFYTASLLRWAQIVGGAESGANTGADFTIGRYNDAGALIDTPILINRATGLITALSLEAVAFGMNSPPVARQNVAGAWAGNTAGKALCVALAAFGLITDSTTP